jgi:RHS repeat-associated protein
MKHTSTRVACFPVLHFPLMLLWLVISLLPSSTWAQVVAPTQGPSLSPAGATETTISLTIFKGDGQGRIVAMAPSPSQAPVPISAMNGTFYTASATYGQGSVQGVGYTVYNGTGNTVTITGLKPSTFYYILCAEYNTDGTSILYRPGNTEIGMMTNKLDEGLVPDSTELRVLHQLYMATGGDSWNYRANWPMSQAWSPALTNLDFATWQGVTVTNHDITALDLNSRNMQGQLPSSIGLLTGLTYLNLPNCPGLTGPLPSSIGQLRNLTYLRTTRSLFTGPLPAELAQLTQLQRLYVDQSSFSGPIPTWLGNLTNLTELDLETNHFTGVIPKELGKLTKLQSLVLSNYYNIQPGQGNKLTGGIPPELGQLTNLTFLDLSLNPIGGTIPKELGNLKNLTFLELDDCHMEGAVPLEVMQLPRLNVLILGSQNVYYHDYNRFTSLPDSKLVLNKATLQLRAHYNQFSFGALEPYFDGPGHMLAPNSFYQPQFSPTGTDTVGFTPGQKLTLRRPLGGQHTHYQWQRRQAGQWQNVAGAQDSVLTVSSASVADSGAYRVQGTNDWVTGLTLTSKAVYALPQAIDPRLQVLRELYEGTDGDHWTHHENWPSGDSAWKAVRDIRACATWYGVYVQQDSLRGLALVGNNLRGHLPNSLGQLRELTYLYLNTNQLTGPLPASLGQLSRLNYLYLGTNQFSGQLPTGLGQLSQLTELGLDHNQFQGSLPADLGQLTNLQAFYVQANQFTGPFPDVLSNANLRLLYVGENQFTGVLPTGLAQLSHLTELGVNTSLFTGVVPVGLVKLPLTALYLHGNAFSDLPGWVGAAHVPANFYVNDNELDFADLEANFLGKNQPLPAFSYDPQRSPIGADTLQRQVGDPAQLAGQIGGAYNYYQWQHQVTGKWVDVPGQTQPTLVWSEVSLSDAGPYRTRVTNGWVGGTTLYSRIHYLDVLPDKSLVRNLPDDTNQDLGSFVTPVDSAAWASRGAGPVPNYVRVWTPRIAVTDSTKIPRAPVELVSMSTQYLDGLGRPIQTVLKQASPGKLDMVQPQAYDGLGREPRQYLPYPALPQTDPAGSFRPQALREQDTFYRPNSSVNVPSATDPTRGVARTGAAYSKTQFEASPLNRVLAQGAAGEAWQLGQGHDQHRLERPNVAQQDSVPRFTPNYNSKSLDPGYQGFYADGELWGTQTTDEHGGQTIEWKDKLGQVVLKQIESSRPDSSLTAPRRWLRTAYVYDDFQHLRFVLQPEASRRMLRSGDQSAALPAAVVPFLFHYRYDARGRQVAKQVPGQDGETLVVYDHLDRPVLSQDAQQRTRKEWSFTKYDVLGRAILSGLVTRNDTLGQVSLQAVATADTLTSHQYEQRSADGATYPQFYSTDHAFPQLGQRGFGYGQVLAATYYDDYDFNNDGQPDLHYSTSTDAQFAAGQAPVADEGRTTGLPTSTLTRVLGVAASDQYQMDWLRTTTFYDERARPVQVQTTSARKNPATGQPYLDLLTTQLDFTGKVVQSVAVHQGPSLKTPIQVAEFFTYDHTGRLLTTKQQLPSEAQPTTIAQVQYNELGQVLRKTIGTGRLQQDVDYAYNIRGWLTSLNDPYQPNPTQNDLFHLSLHYERGFTKGYEQYNGNLTGQTWRGRDGVQRAYGYVYDPLNRIAQGDFVARAGGNAGTLTSAMAWNTELDNYRLRSFTYDDNGNINTLRRQGLLKSATHATAKQYGTVDNLTYAYVGNRLQAVNDAVIGNQLSRPAGYNGAPTSLAGDFQEQGIKLGQEYLYDANGNLTQDKNKGITSIKYNHLNLPRQIQFGQGADSVVFRFSAAGQKVAKLVYQTGKKEPQRTDYLGPYQYEQDSLKFFPHAEGRVLQFVSKDPAGGVHISYQREYTIKDHLGNLRLAYRLGQRRTYIATLEQDENTRKRETQQFDSLSVSPPIAVAVPAAYSNGAGSWAARLNAGGSTRQPLGPLTQLGVQKGDTLRVSAPGIYPQAVNNNSFAFSLASFVASLLQPAPTAPTGADGRKRGGLPLLQVGLNAAGLTALKQFSGVPQGYLRVLVFNTDSVLLPEQSRTIQLSQAALNNYEVLQTGFLPIQQDGYVTVYVGNESEADVYFDDVTVEHRQGLQVQETQYDPAGLELAGLAPPSPGIRGLNNYRFNGKEFQMDLGLNWNHQDWRFFDPQLLRWHAGDPELENGQESWTPYSFGYDNAVRYADAGGRAPEGPPGSTYLKALTANNTMHHLNRSTNAASQILYVKVGGQLAAVGGHVKVGPNVRISAEGKVYPAEVTANNQGVKVEGNALKGGLSAQLGPYKAGVEAKAGTYSAEINSKGNISSKRDETLTGSASLSGGNLRGTQSGAVNSDNQVELGLNAGPGSVTLGAQLDKISETVQSGFEALKAFVNNVVTDVTNNGLSTDPKGRSQEDYVREEKMK